MSTNPSNAQQNVDPKAGDQQQNVDPKAGDQQQNVDPKAGDQQQNVDPKAGDQTPVARLANSVGINSVASTQTNEGNTFERTIADLQMQLKQFQYPNAFVKQLALLFNENKPIEQIKGFVDANFRDVAKMGDEEVVRLSLQQKHPTLNAQQISAIFNDLYPTDEADDESSAFLRAAKISIAAQEARVTLSEGKVGFDPISNNLPDTTAERRAQQAKMEQWKTVGSQSLSVIPPALSVKLQSEAIGGEYTFDFKIPDVNQEQITSALAEYATAAGLPMDQSGLQTLMDYREKLLMLNYQQQFFEAMLSDFYAQIADHFTKKYSGIVPSNSIPPTKGAQKSFPSGKLTQGMV